MGIRRTLTASLTALTVTTVLTMVMVTVIGTRSRTVPATSAVPVAAAQAASEAATATPSEAVTGTPSEAVSAPPTDHHATQSPGTPQSATLQLQSLLGHHVTLAIRFMRATVSGDPGFVAAANASLVRHIDDIEQALEPLAGAEQAAAFGARWEQHTQSLFQYASATRDDDPAAREQAADMLADDLDDLSEVLADLTDDHLSRSAAKAALGDIADQLTQQIDAYAAQDYARAYQLEREVYATASGAGQALAEAATGNAPGSVTYSPRQQLSGTLAQLLGEHVELAVDAMRAGVDGDPEFEAAAGALQGNTTDVASAMSGLFGDRAAGRFNALWADHIDLFVDYTVARAEGDDTALEQVHGQFDDVVDQFGSALTTITDGVVEEGVVSDALTMHEDELFRQIDTYAERDYEQAHDIAYSAYQHMREVAMVLGDGFAKAVGDQLPRGGPQTGGGGTATDAPTDG